MPESFAIFCGSANRALATAVADGVGAEYVPVEEALGLPPIEGEETDTEKQVYATTIETEEE